MTTPSEHAHPNPADLPALFARMRCVVEPQVHPLAAPWPSFVLFFSWSDGQRRAHFAALPGQGRGD